MDLHEKRRNLIKLHELATVALDVAADQLASAMVADGDLEEPQADHLRAVAALQRVEAALAAEGITPRRVQPQ